MINIIAACGLNKEIGYQNQLLCKLENDMQHFVKLTTNNFVCMGRKTYESIGKPLKNRTNIILTRNKDYKAPPGTFVYYDIETVINQYKSLNNNESELFFIGGSEIYSQALPYASKIHLTIIENEFHHADSFFPPFSTIEWEVLSDKTIFHPKDDKNEFDHYMLTYQRRKIV
jgi:dihydrofolate reductase